MSTRKPVAALYGNDVAAWKRIESSWAATKLRCSNRSSASWALEFFAGVLQEQRDHPAGPTSLSPVGYAFLYNEFSTAVAYHSFSLLSRTERKQALLDLGFCAYKALKNRTIHGRIPSRQWELYAQEAIASLTSRGERLETLWDVLSSDLKDTYRFWACKGANAQDWLENDIQTLLKELLPAKEHACFPCLPWVEGPLGVETNMRVAHAYCPDMARILAGLAPAPAWESRKEMLRYAAELAPKKLDVESVDLPSDFAFGS